MTSFDWSVGTTVIIASGPSLTCEQVEYCRSRAAHVLVVNNNHEIAPWADAIYACDAAWWDEYGARVPLTMSRWTMIPETDRGHLYHQQREVVSRFGLRFVRGLSGSGLHPSGVYYGGNSGHQAVGLAVSVLGARRVILLGFDFKKSPTGKRHHHPDHPGKLNKKLAEHTMITWRDAMAVLAKDAASRGVEILNATTDTALACFPKIDLTEAL